MVVEESRSVTHRVIWIVRLLIMALLLAVLLAFIVENGRQVSVHLFYWREQMRLAWALLLAAGLGLVLGVLAARLRGVLY